MMTNEDYMGAMPETTGLTEVEATGQVEAPVDHGTVSSLTILPAANPEPAHPVEFDVTGWNLDRSGLTTLKVKLDDGLGNESLSFLQRAKMDGYLDVPGNEALLEALARRESSDLLNRAEERERAYAETRQKHDEVVLDKFECLFDDGYDVESKRKAEELFGEGNWDARDRANRAVAAEMIADGLFGEYGREHAILELKKNLNLPYDADYDVVYAALKDRFARRNATRIEHEKVKASFDAVAKQIEEEVSFKPVEDAHKASLQEIDELRGKEAVIRVDHPFAEVTTDSGMALVAQSVFSEWKANNRRERAVEKYDQARKARFFSLVDGTLAKKVEALIDASDLPLEAKTQLHANMTGYFDATMKDEWARQFYAGKVPADFEPMLRKAPEQFREVLAMRMQSEFAQFQKWKDARNRFEEQQAAKIREYEAAKDREYERERSLNPFKEDPEMGRDGNQYNPFALPNEGGSSKGRKSRPWNPVSSPKEMKELVRAAFQLNELSRDLAKEDPHVQQLILLGFEESMQHANNNKLLSADQGKFVRFFAQLGELFLDTGAITAQAAGSTVNLVSDTLPGAGLTLEERKIRQRMLDAIRNAQTTPGSLAWGAHVMDGQLRKGVVQAVGSTLTFVSTAGVATITSVWDDEANRLMAEGASYWSAHTRGLAAGLVEYGTENIGGITRGTFKGVKFGSQLAVKPLTKWGKFQRFVEAPLITKIAAAKSIFTPADGLLTRAGGYIAAGRAAWKNKQYGSAMLRTGAAFVDNTLEEAFEEVVGDVVGVPLDRLLAKMYGDPLETIASEDGQVRPWYAETARRAWQTVKDPGLWAGVAVLGGAAAGMNMGRYSREAALASADARKIRALLGCTPKEALDLSRIADPEKRLRGIGTMAVTVNREVKSGKRKKSDVYRNMVEGLSAYALSDDGLQSLDMYEELVAQGKLPEYRKLDKDRYLVDRYLITLKDENGKPSTMEMREGDLINLLDIQMKNGVQEEIQSAVEGGAMNAMVDALKKDERYVVQTNDAGAMYDELVRRWNRVRDLIDMGRGLDEVEPEIDPDRPLGDVLAESPKEYRNRAWIEWQRKNADNPRMAGDKRAFLKALKSGEFVAPAMNFRLNRGPNAGKVFLRFVQGKAGMRDVLEELVESAFKSDPKYDWVQYGNLLRALEEKTGLMGRFLKKKGELTRADVVEGVSRLALSDVMAHPDFYEMPTWMRDAVRSMQVFDRQAQDLARLGADVAAMSDAGMMQGDLMQNVHALMGDAVGYFRGLSNVARAKGMSSAAADVAAVESGAALAEAGLQDTSEVGDLSEAEPAVTVEEREPDESGLAELVDDVLTGKTREDRNREETEKTVAALEAGDKPNVGRVPVQKLELSQEVPQWKEGANEEGETQPLKSQTWDERGVTPLSIWVREDGRLEVISGRHRRALARRLGVANVPCEFYYESDGFSARAARLLDAEMNIRDGNGSSKDFARYCREAGVTKADALARGWFERRQGNGVRIGIYGSENLYDAFVAGKIGEVQAAKIAQAAPGNDALQRVGMREVMENGKSADYAVGVMQAAAVAAQERGVAQLDLFGADDSALNEARKMADYAVKMRRALAKMIRSSEGAINDPENFGKVTKSKVKDADEAMHTLAKLTAAAKRWENFAVHPKLAAEARAWDGKSRVTVRPDALPDAIGGPNWAMNINPQTAETLDALQVMTQGQDIVIHNAQFGDFSFEWGKIGREKDSKGGMGLLHIFLKRMQHGFSMNETARIAILASMAAQEGTLTAHKGNRLLWDKNGVRAIVAVDPDTKKTVITGFVVTDEKSSKGAVDAAAALRSQQFYALDALSRVHQVGAALKVALAWYEDIVKNYPTDYDKVFSAYAESLKIKQDAKVRGDYLLAPNGKKSNLTGEQWCVVRTSAFREWFGDWLRDPENASKVVDENGEPKVVYHGTARADRVGTVFRPDRATSGPMAFFTDNQAIADNYARNKADTSLDYEDEDSGDYHQQFRVMLPNGLDIPFKNYWGYMPFSERSRLAKLAGHIRKDRAGDGVFIVDDGNSKGSGGFDVHLREARGNAFSALVEEWLSSGALFGDEARFLEIINLLNLPIMPYYRDPNYREERVYACFMRVVSPFYTNRLTKKIVTSLKSASKKAKRTESKEADAWDKNSQTPEEWMEGLEKDYADGADDCWTSIPDWVTDWMKQKGYDGIVDRGGKHHDIGHTVYVPFEPTQIKSATDNRGTFGADNPDITFSMRLSTADVCRTRQEAQAMVGRKGRPLLLENGFLLLQAVFNSKSEGKFSDKASIGRTFEYLKNEGLSDDDIKTAHYSAYGNIAALFANAERMKFERAYKKKNERKGMLHVYSPFEIEGDSRQYEANIELEIHQEEGHLPTAYLLNVSIQKRPQTFGRRGGILPLPFDKSAITEIQSLFPEIVKPQPEPGYSMRYLGGEQVQNALAPEHANLAVASLVDNMVRAVNKIGELGNTLRLNEENDREQYINAAHDVTGKLLMLVMAMPEKWRPAINRDLKYLRGYIELAMRGEVDLSAEDKMPGYWYQDNLPMEHILGKLGQKFEEKAHKKIEQTLQRIRRRIEKWGKWQIQKQAEHLFRMATPQVDLVTKRHKRGLMDADSAQRVMGVQAVWNMSRETWEAAMMELADTLQDNEEASAEAHYLQTFGCFERMSLSEATNALEELKKFVRDARTSWDEALDAKRGEQARKNARIVEAVGRPSTAEIKENNKKLGAWKKFKGIPADLQNMAQLYATMRAKGLGVWGDELKYRMIAAGRAIQQCRDERMAEMEAEVKRLGWKSWSHFVNWMHDSGDIEGLHEVTSPVLRERKLSVANAYRMRDLEGEKLASALAEVDMDEDDWKEALAMMEARDELTAIYEEQIENWDRQSRAERREVGKPRRPVALKSKSFVIRREVGEGNPSIPRLTRGQALYIILMSEQPRYFRVRVDEKGNRICEGALPAHGWDEANIEALRRYVGRKGEAAGYAMRRMLQEQGDILRQVYEDEFGVPMPYEENYFPGRFLHPEGGESLRDKVMQEYMGLTPSSMGFVKNRVDHIRPLDLNTDALSVFVKSSMMVDNWLNTHTITQDIDAVLGAEGVSDAVKNAMGPADFSRFKDFSEMLKNAIVLDLSGAAAVENWVNRGLGSYARATLSMRIETILRQMPAVMNGYIGTDGSVTLREYLKTMSHLKRGKARMNYRQMLASSAMRERMRGHLATYAQQAVNEHDRKTGADAIVEWGMAGMEAADARFTALSMVPVWNIYFERAKANGALDAEAEAQAWAAVDEALARGAQPNGAFHKSLFSGSKNAFVRNLGFMLSEDWNKVGQIVSLWKSGARMKAVNSWLIYGAFNSVMMFLLDLIRYDEDDWEKRNWWDYLVSAVYGPLAGVPVLGQMLAGGVNMIAGSLGVKLNTGAGGSQSVVDPARFWRDSSAFIRKFQDGKDHDFAEWAYATGNLFKGVGSATFAMTNWRGSSWFLLAAALSNPVKTVANAKHAWFD